MTSSCGTPARMQRDYEVAAMMTAALRSTLGHMKLVRPVSEVRSPLPEDDYLNRPADPGYCDADSAAHNPRYGVRGMLAYLEELHCSVGCTLAATGPPKLGSLFNSALSVASSMGLWIKGRANPCSDIS